MRTNFQTWLNSLTNDDGSGTTGDLLNVSWFTDQMDVIGGDLDDIDADINALQNVGFLSGYDSVVYTYKDADTITIQAGGQFTVSDDSTMVKVAASTDLKLSTGRSTDCAAEAANTLYYIWGGETALGSTAFFFHTSATSRPSELVKGKLIRGAVYNDNSSNILPFVMSMTTMMYMTDILLVGSDPTEIYDTSLGTSFTSISAAAFVPAGQRVVMLGATQGTNSSYTTSFRNGDDTSSSGIPLVTTYQRTIDIIASTTGVIWAKSSTAIMSTVS